MRRGWITLLLGAGCALAAMAQSPATIRALAEVKQPFGVAFGPDGALYICTIEDHRVVRYDFQSRQLTPVAGSGTLGFSGDGGPALEAELDQPYEVRFDAAGNMYFNDMTTHVVRRVDAKTHLIQTIAGTPRQRGFGGDGGPATAAKLSSPHSIDIDNQKNHLYIADIGNHRIRRVDLNTGAIETVAGDGQPVMPVDGGIATGKPMLEPRALFIEGRNLWIALRNGHSVWRMDLDTARLEHIAGTGEMGFSGDGGDAKLAAMNGPKGIAVGPGGNIFVVDTENQVIRAIDRKSGQIRSIAGMGPAHRGGSGDSGPATSATLDRPHGIIAGPDGAVYIGDTNNHRVRVIQ